MSITFVCGPPCSGKSTYVAQHAQRTDTVLDLDAIARELGSPARWIHDRAMVVAADEEYERRLGRAVAEGRTVWAIRGMPEQARRSDVERRYGAEVVLLDPGEDECIARARRDSRPSGTTRAIRLWYWKRRTTEPDPQVVTLPPTVTEPVVHARDW